MRSTTLSLLLNNRKKKGDLWVVVAHPASLVRKHCLQNQQFSHVFLIVSPFGHKTSRLALCNEVAIATSK